ncbi:UNVERIFIED_CONTAM: cytochrome [Sesamum angustifolium]|uniref:Cytochrome n=1 Tax=Sesamum angustifolium TaxID=2727405 RepID=A0AAW2QTX2_9LAMI
MEIQLLSKLLVSVVFVGVLGLFFRVYNAVVAEPGRLRSTLRKQGLRGPLPTFLLGNILDMKKARDVAAKAGTVNGPPDSHNCGAALLPFFDEWRKKIWGCVSVFTREHADRARDSTGDGERDNYVHVLDLGKPTYQAKERRSLLGQGILTSNGPIWAHQRKILAPELYMDKVKAMISLIQDSTVVLLNSWRNIVEREGGLADINIDQDLRSFSGDVISRACFGSNYSKGEEIFLKLRALQEAASKKGFAAGIPGMRHLPTKSNREEWALEKEVKTLIMDVVKERNEAGSENDLLQMVIEGAKNSNLSQEAIDRFIVDNCKNIYLAGYETTAVSATWFLMLLASHPEWQKRIRAEVLDICKGQIPDAE